VNENAEAVTCLNLNLIIPKILGDEDEVEADKQCHIEQDAGQSKVVADIFDCEVNFQGTCTDCRATDASATSGGHQVSCLAGDGNWYSANCPTKVDRTACGDQSADHISNIQSNTVDDVITTTMDLDEALDYINLKVDLSVKAPVVPAVDLKLAQVPISLGQGIPAGQLKFVGYPQDSLRTTVKDIIDVTGSLTLQDQNGEQVTCIGFGDSADAISV